MTIPIHFTQWICSEPCSIQQWRFYVNLLLAIIHKGNCVLHALTVSWTITPSMIPQTPTSWLFFSEVPTLQCHWVPLNKWRLNCQQKGGWGWRGRKKRKKPMLHRSVKFAGKSDWSSCAKELLFKQLWGGNIYWR